MTLYREQKGFTLAELLVSISLFSIFGLATATMMSTTLQRLGIESRATMANQELQNAVNLLASEVRMSSTVSPYLMGDDPDTVRCSAQFSVAANSMSFLVVHDDGSGANGLRAYHVGYVYDAGTKELRRGQIAASASGSCVLPGGDPTSSSTAQVLAKDIVRIDTDGDGVLEPAFSYSEPKLTLNLGIEIEGAGGVTVTQPINTEIVARSL